MTSRVDEDPELLRRLAEGDPQALAELFAMHRERLRRMVEFRLDPRLLRRVDPDDILQEAYLAAGKRLTSFTDEEGHTGYVWLRLVVAQTMVDVHRQHLGAKMRDVQQEITRFGSPHAQSASMSAHLLGAVTSPSQAAQRAEFSAQLEQILESMDPIDREVLVLRHFEEATNAEVAQILGLQPTAASNRYVRALARLKKILVQIPDLADRADRSRYPEP